MSWGGGGCSLPPQLWKLQFECVLHSNFNIHMFRHCVIFFGKEGRRSPKSEDACMPMISPSIVPCKRQRCQSLRDVLTSERINDSVFYVISMHWLAGHLNKDFCVMGCFSTINGKWVISGSEDNHLYIWDLKTCQVVGKLTGHTRPVLCCHAHPSEQVIVSGSLDKKIKIWRWSLDG